MSQHVLHVLGVCEDAGKQGRTVVVGQRPDKALEPRSFVVLPYVDDEWHHLFLTVRTEAEQKRLRMSCALVGNGLVCFDDMTAIEGTTPTDVPEIVCLDIYGRASDGEFVRVPQAPTRENAGAKQQRRAR